MVKLTTRDGARSSSLSWWMTENSPQTLKFSRLRAFFWPIRRQELKKLLPLLFIFFLISFNYNVLRTMKDTLVITEKASGAEVIPFIKFWVLFPASILMTLLYTKLSNRLDREKVFYIILSLFLLYFFFFVFFLYPARDSLHPHEAADALQAMLPPGCKGLVALFRNWTLTFFYVMAELWSNIVFFVLLWGFTNQVTRVDEAVRFYPILGTVGNAAGFFAGQASIFFCRLEYNPSLPFGKTDWEQNLMLLVSLLLISGLLVMILFRYLHTHVLNDPRYYPEEVSDTGSRKVKMKISMRQSFRELLSSRYLLYIALIMLGYNIAINLTEVIWKDQVKALYPNPKDFNFCMNEVVSWLSIVATFGAWLIPGNVIRRYGWTVTAMLTPVILFITSVAFFGLFLTQNSFAFVFLGSFAMSPLSLIVLIGSLQNIFCRGAKYTVFDSTKEMAFIPLDNDSKIKGKAVVDGVCNRLGKGVGSLLQQGLLIIFSTLAASAPYIALLIFCVVSIWMASVWLLGKEFEKRTLLDKSAVTKTPSLLYAEQSVKA